MAEALTHNRLVELFSWADFSGFTGDTCDACKKTANVPSEPGWFCEDETCNHYNLTNYDNLNVPLEKPDYGPTGEQIRAAIAASSRSGRIERVKEI